MPNSFTVVPNILPGNVTIGGNLTVSGDVLRVGAVAPFVRLMKDIAGVGHVSYNLAQDNGTQDDLTKQAFGYQFNHGLPGIDTRRVNTAASVQQSSPMAAIFTDYVQHSHTGTTTEDTIYSKVIPANTLGANGGVKMLVMFNASVQGATAATFRVRFNGGLQVQFTFATTQSVIVEMWLQNHNAGNSNIIVFRAYTPAGTVVASGYFATQAVDFTVDETLTVTIQNGTSTDTQSFDTIQVHQTNSFGPV